MFASSEIELRLRNCYSDFYEMNWFSTFFCCSELLKRPSLDFRIIDDDFVGE